MIMLRVKELATAEMLPKQLPRGEVFSLRSVSGVNDSSDPGSGIDFSSRNEDRTVFQKSPCSPQPSCSRCRKGRPLPSWRVVSSGRFACRCPQRTRICLRRSPLHGRSKGTGHPGLVFFNRGAEPLVFDPPHRADRKKNAHMLILGPTGAGKSTMLVYLLQQMAAMYRPRVFIIEAGGSFSLLGQQFQAHGLTVNQVPLTPPNTDVSLPPFADALRVLQKERQQQLRDDPDALEEDDELDGEGTGRDVLGEMEIAARIMITGGDEREDAPMTRAARLLIQNAIFLAAKTVKETGRDPVPTQDVAAALQSIGHDESLPDHDLVERYQHDARPTLVVTDEGHIITTNPFRNAPPPLLLVLAMTGKHEKAERGAIMQERNCSELEAVHVIAERIAESR